MSGWVGGGGSRSQLHKVWLSLASGCKAADQGFTDGNTIALSERHKHRYVVEQKLEAVKL